MTFQSEGGDLLQPITAEQPCGENLEDTPLLASFDAFRLYGRTKPLEPPPEADGLPKTLEDRDERPPEWEEIKNRSLEALAKSKDLRLLAHLGTAALRTDGLAAFADTIKVASQWLDTYWNDTYPLVDGDGIVRRSALNCFADPLAVVDAVRRAPIVKSRQHGTFSLREIDLATNPGSGGAETPDPSQINAAFSTIPAEELTQLHDTVSGAVAALRRIDQKMRDEIGTEAAPEFDPLSTQLTKIDRVLRAQLAARPGGAGTRRRRGRRGGRRRRPGGGRCDQVSRGRHPEPGGRGGVFPEERALESRPAVLRPGEAPRGAGFPGSARRGRSRGGARGASGRRLEVRVGIRTRRRCVVAKASSQKFIARNRAPRVQIEYDVELYGAEKKIQLPFVMGVLADLSGRPAEPLPAVPDRKFLDIDVDNFDSRLKAMKPRVAFQVPNTLTGEGNLNVELTFESMDDFSPAAVARRVDALNKLLQARQQLANLITYMDGKSGAEELVAKLLQDPALLQTLAASKKELPETT